MIKLNYRIRREAFMMYSEKNKKFKNFQEGLVNVFKNLFTDSSKKVSEETKNNELLFELKERGIVFANNYLNNINIDSTKNFKFELGYKINSSQDFKFYNLEGKRRFLNSLEGTKLNEKIDELIKEVNNAISIVDFNSNSVNDPQDKNTLNNIKNSLAAYKQFFTERKQYFNNHLTTCKLGLNGENIVNEHLDMHSNIINLKNIRLRDDLNRECQCDNIVITKRGIFIIEVKNYGSSGNYSIKIDSTGRWSMKVGKSITPMNNPTEQNNRHIAIVNRILQCNLGLNISAHGIISIANETVDIINESKDIVVRPSSLYNIMDNEFTSENITAPEMEKISNYISSNSLPDKKYPILSLDEEFSDMNIKKFNFLFNKAISIARNLAEFERNN
ncbi:NERD domain-containing protein [Clostridium perfringens]|nr:NERD domain-containing protein [Clostridium perfringens]